MSAQRLAYTSDLPDEEWQIREPLLPPANPEGRPRKSPLRDVIDAIPYVLRAGCAWRLMPHDLPHWQTAYHDFRAWRQDGPWVRLHDQRRATVCTRMGCHPQPTAAIIDAQTVQTTDKGGPTALMARSNSTAASVIASLRRRVSGCASSCTPPI
jgi:putative transposase